MMSRLKQWLSNYFVKGKGSVSLSEVCICLAAMITDSNMNAIPGGREENRPITVAHIVEHSMVYR